MSIQHTSSISQWISGVGQWIPSPADFQTPAFTFRKKVSRAADAQFPPESGRYHLYVAYACPWSHRVLIMRHLKGLQQVLPITAMHWQQDQKGWRFATESEQDVGIHMVPDPHHESFTHLRDIYAEVDPRFAGRFTTPVLYDTRSGSIVSNQSADILKMMDTEFDDLLPPARRGLSLVTLVPYDLVFDILAANAWIYKDINIGVCKVGSARTQDAYEETAMNVFLALDRVEEQLEIRSRDGPYFFGERMTETDIRLFATIIRFDPVYVQHFKLNFKDIRTGYPWINSWMRRLYWSIPAFRETTNFDHIKLSYTKNQTPLNPFGITPLGPEFNVLPLGPDDERIPIGPASPQGSLLWFQWAS